MTRESSKILLARDALLMGEASGRTILDGDATLAVIDEIYDDFEETLKESEFHLQLALAQLSEYNSRTCGSCMYDDDCDIKWKIVENARKPQEPKWCSLWEAKYD